ncbi:glutamate synthase-related protein [Escherichia coli]
MKVAQGAKPGEGGQLPGDKVTPYIAKLRYSGCRSDADLPAAAPRYLLYRGLARLPFDLNRLTRKR